MKKIIFTLLLVLAIVPLKAQAENRDIWYFNYGEYNYSEKEVLTTDDLEVTTKEEDGKTIYISRTREYISLPFDLIITSKDFKLEDVIKTNIPISMLKINQFYDLETMNNCYGSFEILYEDTSIGKLIYIDIDEYIQIPKQIVVDGNNFDIYEHIVTNIFNKYSIEIIGEYDLTTNGVYDISLKYNDILETTQIIVDNKDNVLEEDKIIIEDDKNNEEDLPPIEEDNSENKEQEEENKKENLDQESDEKLDNTIIPDDKEDNIIYEYETNNNYINNYMTDNNKENDKTTNPIQIIQNPITEKTIYKSKSEYFDYITYAFYIITVVFLSIIVVRKS